MCKCDRWHPVTKVMEQITTVTIICKHNNTTIPISIFGRINCFVYFAWFAKPSRVSKPNNENLHNYADYSFTLNNKQ